MSVTINEVTIASVVDRRLELQNAQWAAKLDLGSSWTRLRVGCRVVFDDLGVNVFGDARFYLGVMATPSVGLVNGPLGSTTNHFIGMRTDTDTWTRVAGGTYLQSSNNDVGKKIDDIFTSGSAASSSIYDSWKEATIRCIHMVEIEKISSVSTGVRHSFNIRNADVEDTKIDWLTNAMEINDLDAAEDYIDSEQSHGGVGQFGGIHQAAIATDEVVDGSWDSIVCAWDRSNPMIHVSDMMFAYYE